MFYPLDAKHRGFAAIPMNLLGNLSVPSELQQKLAVIIALAILPPAI
jgi:hypothetical protein